MKSYEAFIEALKDNADIKRYQQLEQVLMSDETLNQLLKSLKEVQKQYVHAQSFKQKENERHFKKQLDDLQNQIDDFPLMKEYLNL